MNPTAPTQLPLERILSSLDAILSLVIEAPPGAGKTTRVPPALLQFGGVLVLEPRAFARPDGGAPRGLGTR